MSFTLVRHLSARAIIQIAQMCAQKWQQPAAVPPRTVEMVTDACKFSGQGKLEVC